MKLYDELIHKTEDLMNHYHLQQLSVVSDLSYPVSAQNEMVLRSDMAYELGSQYFYALSSTFITDSLEVEEGIYLLGDDLSNIKEDRNYARISIIKVKENTLGEGNNLYNAVKAIDNIKYHIRPLGYMMRVSSINKRESVRVSKEAIKKGISFSDVGNQMMQLYKKNKMIEAVKIIFINLESFDYKTLESYSKEESKITKAIDHMLSNTLMDCHSCNLEEVCNEVEGLKELHFGLSNK